jgi:ABC-type Co2+ transport system permease subunit
MRGLLLGALGWPGRPAPAPALACARCAKPLADTTASSLARRVLEASVRALVRECASRDAEGCAEVSTLALGEIVTASVSQLQSGAHYRVVAHTSAGDLAIAFARHAAPVCVLVVEGATLASVARAQHVALLQAPLHLPPSPEGLVEEACRVRSPPQSPPPLSSPPPSPPRPLAGPAVSLSGAGATGDGSNHILPAACLALLAVLLFCLRAPIGRLCGRALAASKGAAAAAATAAVAPRRSADERSSGAPSARVAPSNRCPRTTKLIRDCKCHVCEHLTPPAQPQPASTPLPTSAAARARVQFATEPQRQAQQLPQQPQPLGAGAAQGYSFADSDAIYVPSKYVYQGTPGSPSARGARDSRDSDEGEWQAATAGGAGGGTRTPLGEREAGRQPRSTARVLAGGPSPWTPRTQPSARDKLASLFGTRGGRMS